MQELYANPFQNAPTITGLLDLQTPATLIKPFVHSIQPGAWSTENSALSTRLGGSALGVLIGASVADPTAPMFRSLSFESETFRSWLAPGLSDHVAAGAADITIDTDDPLTGLGRLICRGGTKGGSDLWSRTMRTTAMFAITFDAPQSLDAATALSFACDRLLGFLVGARLKPPEISLALAGQPDDQRSPRLRLAGAQWTDDTPPHFLDCPHSRRVADGTLPQLVHTFLTNKDRFLAAIDAVEFSRFFSTDLMEKFKAVVPVLEQSLKRLFKSPDEANYMEREAAYWQWFNATAPQEFAEFSRKHLKLVNQKPLELTTLLGRAITLVNDCGFDIPNTMADRIKARRGRLFHSAPHFQSTADATAFALETRAATLLLLLLTYRDLGIDIARLATRPEALRDFTMFMHRPVTPPL